MGGHAQMVSFLLAAKADPDLPNSCGVTPRQLADVKVQELFAEPVLNPRDLHLSNFVENSSECSLQASLKCNERDLATVWMHKPLQSTSSGLTRAGPEDSCGCSFSDPLAVVWL